MITKHKRKNSIAHERGNCEIKVNDRLNLNDLCYLMDYQGGKLECTCDGM